MTYRIFGSELSPYSVKVRSYFRFKGLPHDWIPRSPAVQAEFQKYAKLPLVPFLKEEVAGLFLPWSTANAAAIAAGQKSFEMTLGGAAGLDATLSESDCLSCLSS